MDQQEGQPLGQGPSVAAEVSLNESTNPVEELTKKYRLQVVSDNMEQPPIRWVVEGLIEEKSPTMVVSQPKVGKTWVMLFLAVLVALGVSGSTFFEREVKITGKPVIYFCGEGHITQVMKRVDALLKAMNKKRGDLGGRLRISDQSWHIGDHRRREEQYDLTDTQSEIVTIVSHVEPAVIFIDPLIRFTRGENEDKSYEMSPITNFIQHVLCRHAAVVIGHHTDKKGKNFRGTGDLLGFAATQLFLDGAPCSNRFKVETILRNAAAPEPFMVRLDLKSVENDAGEQEIDTAEVNVAGAVEKKAVDPADVESAKKVFLQNWTGLSINKLRKDTGWGVERAQSAAQAAGAIKGDDGKWYIPEFRDRMQASFRSTFSVPPVDD